MPRTTMGLLLLLLQVVLLSAAARAQTAQAWGKEGHYMTCKIADGFLTSEGSMGVKALLPSCANGELAEVCAWADSQRFRYRWSSPLHFADTPGDCKFSYATTGESRSNRSSTGSLTPSRHRGRIGTNAVVFFHVDISMLINVLFLIGIVAVIFFHVDISMLPILDCFREWIINFTGECIRYWISSSAQQGLGADTGSWASGAGAGSRLWINTSAAVPGRSSIPLGGAMSGRSSSPWEEERLPQSKDAWEQQRLRGGAPLPAQGRLGEAAPGGAVGGRALPSAWSRGRWAEVEDDPDRDDPDRDFKLAIGGVIWSF